MGMQSLHRRSFLTSFAALTLHAKPVSKLKFGLTSYQWGADWDIPTMIANCTKAKAFGVELRTSAKYKHGVELNIDAAARAEVKRMFSGSPVKLVGINSAERFDWPDAAALKTAIEAAKAHAKLAHDTGATGIRVFPNQFQKGVPEGQTLEQIARSVNEVGKYAADFGQMVRMENHGPVGTLVNLRTIMSMVEQKNVRIKLNGDVRDNEGGKFAQNFAGIKDKLGDTLHMRWLDGSQFPYQLQWDLLTAMNWDGWCFVEESVKVPDRVQALIEMRETWEKSIANSLSRLK
jgi:Xylose isomerase-like TIM barrel